jgi:hypothetical protein
MRAVASCDDMQFFDGETMSHHFHARILSVVHPEIAA